MKNKIRDKTQPEIRNEEIQWNLIQKMSTERNCKCKSKSKSNIKVIN